MKDSEFIEGVRAAIAFYDDGGEKREALEDIRALLKALPPPKTCAHCNEVLGDKYRQDVPNVGDLCLTCHKLCKDLGTAKSAKNVEPKRDQHGHFKTCYDRGCNATKCGTSTPPPLRNPFNDIR